MIAVLKAILARIASLLLELGSVLLSLLGAAIAAWKTLPVRTRRAFVSYPAALLFHGLILLAFASLPAARQLGLGPSLEQGGRPGGYNGRTFSFLLVSSSQGADVGSQDDDSPKASQDHPRGERGNTPARPLIDSAVPVLVAGAPDDESESYKTPTVAQDEAAASPAASSQGEVMQSAIQSGDPDGAQNLLRQIARCLPADRRPVIAGAKLAVSLDAGGSLTAAPSLDISTSRASEEEIADANLVIQAALQCGPYQAPKSQNIEYALAADFSFLEPRDAGLKEPRHGR